MDVNSAAENATGFDRISLIGTNFSKYFTDPERALAGCHLAFLQGFAKDLHLSLRHNNGRTIDVLFNASVYHDGHGAIAGLFAAARDITGLKRSQARLERTNNEILILGSMTNLLQSCQLSDEAYPIINAAMMELLPETSGACFVYDKTGHLLQEVSSWGTYPVTCKLFPPEDCWALRRGHMHLVGGSHAFNPRCNHLRSETDPYICVPLLAQGKSFGLIYIGFCAFEDDEEQHNRNRHIVEAASDSIGLALANLTLRESLRVLSFHDQLTGLANRRFMEESFQKELFRAKRLCQNIIIAMIDIDEFKYFNDTYGHDAGDYVLREISALMIRFRRGTDIICRYGGEEFIIIISGIDLKKAAERLEQLRGAIAEINLTYNGAHLPNITISVGISIFPEHGDSMTNLIKASDDALFQAKRGGRNKIIIYGDRQNHEMT